MRLLLENLPPSLAREREVLARCIEAMNCALPLRAVYLFGSHARGEARADSDVDLCVVAEGAERQLQPPSDSAARCVRSAANPLSRSCRSPRRDLLKSKRGATTSSRLC